MGQFRNYAAALATLLATSSALAVSPTPLSIGTKGDELAYDHDTLTVKHGAQVALTFKNNATPASGLTHNWVLAKPGTTDAITAAAAPAGEAKGYIPDSPDIIAHSKLLKSGESQTVTFKAPDKPGSYPYFCTFPGHSGLLKGTLVVN
jgi:azurin